MGADLASGRYHLPAVDLSQTQHLITQALKGAEEDVGELLEHIRPRLVLWAASRLSSGLGAKVEPEDVAQETLLQVHKYLDTFRGTDERAFLAWVFHIAENRIRDLADWHGAKKRQPIVPLSFSQTSPSTAASRRERVQQVVDALQHLNEDQREVVRLLRFEGRTTKEIAELKDCSENAVRIRYFRAMKALRKAMNGPEEAA